MRICSGDNMRRLGLGVGFGLFIFAIYEFALIKFILIGIALLGIALLCIALLCIALLGATAFGRERQNIKAIAMFVQSHSFYNHTVFTITQLLQLHRLQVFVYESFILFCFNFVSLI